MIDTYRDELATRTRGLLPAHLRRKVEADDVVQEVYERLVADDERFSDRTEPEIRAYLLRTLESVIHDLVRRYDRGKRQVAREFSLESSRGDASDLPGDWLAADHTSPSGRARHHEQLARLARAMSALPDDQREAVTLHHLKGLPLEATASAMHRTKPAAAGLLRRGLVALRAQLVERVG